jgi:hypothetical protein
VKIQGIWGNESSCLDASQWVNVWQASELGLEFYDTCQVKDLGALATEDYVLELVETEP